MPSRARSRITISTSPTSSGIERRRDLVEEHHVRLHHQRAGDRDPLLLAAGELVRVLARLLRQPDVREQLERAGLGLGARLASGSGARRA